MPDPDTVEVEVTNTQNMPIFLPRTADTDINLTCTVILESVVDIPVTVQTEWSRVDSFQRNADTHTDALNTYSSMITIRSIDITNAGEYRCHATVNTVSSSSRRYVTGEGNRTGATTLSLCEFIYLSKQLN